VKPNYDQARQSAELQVKVGRKLIADASRAINAIQDEGDSSTSNAYVRAADLLDRGVKIEREAIKELQRIERLSQYDGSTSPY